MATIFGQYGSAAASNSGDAQTLTAAQTALPASGLAIDSCIRVAVTAGGGGSADDVAIFTANAPFKFRILDTMFRCSAGNSAGRTVTLRDATAGGGNACSDALACTNTGLARDAALTATRTIAAGGTLVLRRSDSAIAGELVVQIIPEP